MKKKTLALFGAVAFAGVALASCGKKSGDDNKGGEEAAKRVHVDDAYYTGTDNSSGVCTWNPISYETARSAYNVSGTVDTWLVYSSSYGTTYNGILKTASTQNPIDGITYNNGDTLPAWKTFASTLGLTSIRQMGNYGENDATNYKSFKGAKTGDGIYTQSGNIADLFYNTTANLNELGDDNQLVDLTQYITGDNPKMPAFKKFLDDNPEVKAEITHNNKIFYTPYLDGYQAIERNYVMDTEQVEKLLDNALPSGTGLLAAGKDGDAKGLNTEPKAQQFIGSDGDNYDKDLTIAIVNPKNNQKVNVTVKKTDNILKLQNEALAKGTTGAELITQFKNYAQAAYGDIITNYYDGKISKMFTSVGACYNADDLVALLRIFKANPDVLYGSADVFDAVVPVFPRGQANNRVENILNFGATLYGVQGRGSEYDHLFFGADNKIHDFDTVTASYDMLDKLNALYAEGLIQENFWSGSDGSAGINTFFKKNVVGKSTFGLMEYDYTATQSAGNDIQNGIGTKASARKTSESGFDFATTNVTGIKCILSPLTYVSSKNFTYDQALDNNTGKEICRYYEENRAVKNTSWSIPKGSDNIESAVALMDFMFTKEGWQIQNFGPGATATTDSYWELATVLGEENTPVLKQAILNHFADCGIDFWNYCRGFLGTTQGIGHYRPTTLDYQATNQYTRNSYDDLVLASKLGVQMTSRSIANVSDITWHSSMPMAVFSTLTTDISNTYAGVTTFWAQAGKASSDGTMNGWVAIVAEGSGYSNNVLTSVVGKDYSYKDVKDQRATKNENYLYPMASKLDMIPTEALKA